MYAERKFAGLWKQINKSVEEEKGMQAISGLVENDEKVWLPIKEINALFLVDLKTGVGKYITSFHEYEKNMAWIIGKVVEWNKKRYFFSRVSYEVWVLDEKGVMQHITYAKQEVPLVGDVAVCNGKAWIFTNTSAVPILILDLLNFTVSFLHWNKWKNRDFYYTTAKKKKDFLYLLSRNEQEIFLIEIDCNAQQIRYFPFEQFNFIEGLCVRENLFVLGLLRDGSSALVEYDIRTKQEVDIKILMETSVYNGMGYKYFGIAATKAGIVFLPISTNKMVLYDIGEKNEKAILLEYDDATLEIGLSMDFQETEKFTYMFPYASKEILCIDKEQGTVESIDIKIDAEEWNAAFLNLEDMKLRRFIKGYRDAVLPYNKSEASTQKNIEHGERIYNMLKD